MRRLITGHSRIHCGADTGLPVAIAMQWENFSTQLGDLHRQDFGLEAEQVRANMAELLTGLIGAPSQNDPGRIVVEKTSLNVLAFERLGRLLTASPLRPYRPRMAAMSPAHCCNATGAAPTASASPMSATRQADLNTGLI